MLVFALWTHMRPTWFYERRSPHAVEAFSSPTYDHETGIHLLKLLRSWFSVWSQCVVIVHQRRKVAHAAGRPGLSVRSAHWSPFRLRDCTATVARLGSASGRSVSRPCTARLELALSTGRPRLCVQWEHWSRRYQSRAVSRNHLATGQ